MDAVKREIQEPSSSKPVEALAVTNQYRRGYYRCGRYNSLSSEECRNHPKNKRQKGDQHAKVNVL
uniref:Uncharacterized protein n=1 Tax=Daphnia galeata TaxID=27404 RepID=A0A8J2S108_9CRUS|nr:unnamed protein product [Daphnia galeata]